MTTTPDIPLLRKAVEWVEEQDALPPAESRWVQSAWRLTREGALRTLGSIRAGCCSSCDRSRRVALSRLESRSCGTAYCVAGWACEQAGLEWGAGSVGDGILADGRAVPTAAMELLGLDMVQGTTLFHVENTAKDIRRIAESIAGEPL